MEGGGLAQHVCMKREQKMMKFALKAHGPVAMSVCTVMNPQAS